MAISGSQLADVAERCLNAGRSRIALARPSSNLG